jgi:hypothetical protein
MGLLTVVNAFQLIPSNVDIPDHVPIQVVVEVCAIDRISMLINGLLERL